MEKKNNSPDLDGIMEKIIKFRKARDWEKFHNPKNLAISISLEASELLEHFQWLNFQESIKYAKDHKEEISREISDIIVYLLYLSHDLDIDLLDSVDKKISENDSKYPIDKSKGKSLKYNQI